MCVIYNIILHPFRFFRTWPPSPLSLHTQKSKSTEGRLTMSRRKHHHQIDLKHTTYLTDLSIHVQAVDLQPRHCHLTDGKHDLGHKHMISTFSHAVVSVLLGGSGGLLTPLTFAWQHLSRLAVFTSNVYFLHNGRWWQEICEVYRVNFNRIFEGS